MGFVDLPNLFVPFILLSITLIFALLYKARRAAFVLPLPPGPKPLPVLGNILDMPVDKPWLVYDQWCKKYGDIVHVNILGQPIIILGSKRRAFDLFERRSSIYSDRSRLPMLNELSGWGFNFAFMPYGHWWRQHRRLFHTYFHSNAVFKYQPIQIRESRAFLRRLLHKPEEFMQHIRHTFAATIMDITYGILVREDDDPYVFIAEESFKSLREASVPGTFLVDLFPILKYVPPWVPGAGFKRKAAYWETMNNRMVNNPFQTVWKAQSEGTAGPSVLLDMLERLPDGCPRAEAVELARNCAGIAYAGGADTSIISVQMFFLAMAMHPEAQKKAQAELDRVVGGGRLPDFDDRDALPYVSAVIKEVVRWQPAAPLGIAHACSADDEYDGFLIPKGAIVVGNSWAILHDPDVYPSPEMFRPERFLTENGSSDPSVQDPYVAVFGYGRRICPGRYLGDNSLFSVVSSVLATFDILPPIDEAGCPIQLRAEVSTGLLSYVVTS